jgi:alpha-L-fucosidase
MFHRVDSPERGNKLATHGFALGARWWLGVVVAATVAIAAAAVVALSGNRPASADLQNPRLDCCARQRPASSCARGCSPRRGTRTARRGKRHPGRRLGPQLLGHRGAVAARQLPGTGVVPQQVGIRRPWPSSIPGTCSTKTDFLGQLVAAAHAKNMRVILYMTNTIKFFNNSAYAPDVDAITVN